MSFSALSRRSALALLGSAPFLGRAAYAATPQTLRVGIMSGEDEDIWRVVTENAAKAGLTLKITPFSDYNGPNEALFEHELDANAFQHGPFLAAQNSASNFHIVPVGNTYFAPIGLYATRWKSVADLPKNATIGVPNDPSNEGRALKLLQTLGLIKVSDSAGLTPTALDVTENPRNITIRELDAGVVGRALPDLDAAVVNTEWARKAGIDVEKQRIGQESLQNNPYVCFIAVNEADHTAPWVAPLVAAYQQPNVRQALLDVYHGAIVPAWS
ncbi:MetQ/NlpA family ABC transporter substrate-binding protein [Acetobacter senegalensis]|uniref:MetQ/NlpA family ABC transporter substrate-binding protein n=1 Tax=Acetobacter senegalensis TaxID=446692 RepID=UPI00264A806A|nr:MetQ/NlpA family ABC transporter substrate-binding protein [Acetobacter senegalensis]MDN7351059.1 MetQ/NlpA family ABC transporter substrate-binding protein [Acetobacter senegalensis]